MFRSALLILSGNAAASLLLLARNLIIARLIPVEDYGIAATFAITMAVVEMMSQLGLQQQIVQARDGEDTRFQAGLQGFQVLRGVLSGALLFLSAGWIADFLNIPHVAWAYQVMALVPVLTALQHFDIHRLNRQMRFWPVVLTGAVPALISLALVWPLYLWMGDYRVMLWAIIAQMALMTLVSHLVAERPYRLVLDRGIMAGSLRFGWPLLVNGILMFGVFNGDKLIVGRVLGMETLAIFAMGFTLTLTPALVIAKSLNNFFLPQLSAAANAPTDQAMGRFSKLMSVTFETSFIMGLMCLIMTCYLGELFISFFLGERYAELNVILVWLAVIQTFRIFKTGSSVVALAKGQTSNPMIANIVRILALPIAFWGVVQFGTFDILLITAIVAEILGFGISLALIKWRLDLSLRALIRPFSLSTVVIAVVALRETDSALPYIDGMIGLAFLLAVAGMTNLWRYTFGGKGFR